MKFGTAAAREFWKSSGIHLLERDENGWLRVTPDYLRAYLTRPEVHPIEGSCANEIALFEELMADPTIAIDAARLAGLADQDAADSYKIVLGFRDELLAAGSIEGAYLSMIKARSVALPPVFIDQMVHVILRNMLADCDDPLRLRAAELFFREQTVNTDDGRLMLADAEIVEMHAADGGAGSLGQLLSQSATPMRQVELDVLDDDNAQIYWERSDRFDTVVDFRFTQPALDGFARVVELWMNHMLRLQVRVQPKKSVDDPDWRWHVGLDREATQILNALYRNETVAPEDLGRIVALFQMEIVDGRQVIDEVRGKPIYLGLAMTNAKRLRMKPQNLLANLPLLPAS